MGKGSISEVLKAFDTQLHRYVAIKFLHDNLQAEPAFVTRFQHEAQIVASLRHPNIVQYYDYAISQLPPAAGITAYMWMSYVKGRNLASYIRISSPARKFLPTSSLLHLFTYIVMPVC